MEKKKYEQSKLEIVVSKGNDVLTGSNAPFSNENGFNLGNVEAFWES